MNFGIVNYGSKSEKESTYNGIGTSLHWTDLIEVLLAVIAFRIILKKIIDCLRRKSKKNKFAKLEELKSMLESQTTA